MTPPPDALGTVTLKEAARLTGLSLSTLRRRRDELRDHGATQGPDGAWIVPVHALVDLGWLDRVTPSTAPAERASAAPPAPPTVTPPGVDVADLLARLAEAERRAAVAEAIAAERERVVEAQGLALRALTASTTPPDTPPVTPPERVPETPPEPPVAPPGDAPRRSWWRSLFGGQ